MQNEETTVETQDEQKEGQTVEVEETTTEDTEETSETDATEETPEAKIIRLQNEANKWQRLYNKKGLKPNAGQPAKTPPASSQPNSVEEAVLLANGMNEELLEKLKKVAQVEGISSLIKAQTNPIFVAVKEKFEKEEKAKGASLPASRGSGSVKAKKDFNSPDLTAAEHKKLYLESL